MKAEKVKISFLLEKCELPFSWVHEDTCKLLVCFSRRSDPLDEKDLPRELQILGCERATTSREIESIPELLKLYFRNKKYWFYLKIMALVDLLWGSCHFCWFVDQSYRYPIQISILDIIIRGSFPRPLFLSAINLVFNSLSLIVTLG